MTAPHEPRDPAPAAPARRAGERTPATDPAQMHAGPVARRPARASNRQPPAHRHDGDGHAHDTLPRPHTADGVPRPKVRREDYAHIAGWGADLDRARRPAVPMERSPARLDPVAPPQQQVLDVEVLHSSERPGLTPVFGTTVPPRGLSGAMRRLAFRFSENDIRHWLTLLAADRVHVVEGLLADLARGHVPNVYAEMGGRAELKHNPAGAARKAVVLGVVIGATVVWWRRRRRH